ncbi:MAG: radical SAM family heme chaperone HemW [Planctomycetota bacterium]|nr:radical SAM family heme chaperone HemW [Planctomycetota bacterium]
MDGSTNLGPRPPEAPLPRALEGTPLYVHLPFCAAKCHYCDFFSVPDEGQDLGGMVAAILREAEQRAPQRPRTLFLGGGTPSLLPASLLARLLDGLHELTGWRDSVVEATAECNPESLDRDKARAFLDLGVPRLSVGVQALDDEALRLFGRVHSAADSLRAVEAAQEAGVEELSVDLIYAWPGQTLESWIADLGTILGLGTHHLSAYNLTYEEDTRFKRWLDRGELSQAPEELELELFQAVRKATHDAGLEAYEVSNYSSSGYECDHNINYWHAGDYVGLGPGAVSKVGPVRAGAPRGIAPYLRWIEASGHATAWRDAPTAPTRLAEAWWLGLRLREGLSAQEALIRAGWHHSEDPSAPVVEELLGLGMLERVGERVRLSEAGIPVADAVAGRFLRELSEDTPTATGPGSAAS